MSMDEPNSARQKNNNHRIAYRQKIALVLFGIIAAVFILECLLRILGFALLFTQQREGRKSVAGTRVYTILCMGDSFTWGVGAAEGGDYPHQLKAMLSAAYQGRDFNVITDLCKSNRNKFNPMAIPKHGCKTTGVFQSV